LEKQKLWKAAIYIRISKENGDDTLENQKNIILDYLNQFSDIQICSIKIDDGYSGLNCVRPAFQEMLQDIRSGSINCVVVRDLSRLSRNYIDAGSYINTIFPALGVRFISTLEGLDITGKMDDNSFLLVSIKNIESIY
jgi:DNA invertase Pin-like site-specific DNA recombinase